MRDAFLNALTSMAEIDRDVVLLTADLGFGVFEEFEARFPGQYFNVGVAEQNMTGVATGLALEGKRVFTYSIGNFPTLRCLEQIRNDAGYHDANVTVVASGGGFSYGSLGMSHHCTEDIAILRALPNVSVVAPGTTWEAGEATKVLAARSGVGYLRLDKTQADDGNGAIGGSFEIGRSRCLREGDDITLITTGGILEEVVKAAEHVANDSINCRVLSFHSIKPIDIEAVKKAVSETSGVITIEEHNIVGGLGSAVAEVCMDLGMMPKKFKRIGLNDVYSSVVGSQAYLRKHYQMDSTAVIQAIQDMQD